MRGHVDKDPIAIADDRLREAARRYSGLYLQAPFGAFTDEAAEDLRVAAVNYSHATTPKRTAKKGGG